MQVQHLLKTKDGRRANLQGADLWGADLRGADLRGADLQDAGLWGADLRGGGLRNVDLRNADLRNADLRGADLRGADLRNADLRGAKFSAFKICPEEGDFIGWKRVGECTIKLLIPDEAQRMSSLVGRKCRGEFALVLEGNGTTRGLLYTAGQWVLPDSYNDDIRIECTNGIHFFITKQEAIDFY